MLNSVANEHHRTLREKALHNLNAVVNAVPNYPSVIPHLNEVVSALWLRSIAVGNLAGAEPATLHVDVTRDVAIDDNAFQVELATVVENSFNIHLVGSRLVFREEENPQAKLMACARNDRLFADGSDLVQLGKEIRYAIGGSEGIAKAYLVIALPKSWVSDPWSPLDESEQPDRWDQRLPLLILPEEPDKLNERLGCWIKEHLQKRRNTPRFLLPRSASLNVFQDRDLLILARAAMKALEWSNQSPEYGKLHRKYQTELRDILKKRFDRFAILQRWNYTNPALCEFQIESLHVQGAQIPEAVEKTLANDLFVPEDFEALALTFAIHNDNLGKLLKELQEPQPQGKICIPWLGESIMKEHVLRLCARGKIALDLRGSEHLQTQAGESEEAAWMRMKSKLYVTGNQLNEVKLLLPLAQPTTGGSTPGVKETPILPTGGETTPVTEPNKTPTGGGIFGGNDAVKHWTPYSNPATSPVNLIGKLETWGINTATPVKSINLKLNQATGAQLKELLKKLPDGMTFELSLEKEQD